MKKAVSASFCFSGVHCWDSQPEGSKRSYLSHPHRHVFFAEVCVGVQHNDRDVEILSLKSTCEEFIQSRFQKTDGDMMLGNSSCEDLCEMIFLFLKSNGYSVLSVSVKEDNENGAYLWDE